MKRASIVLSFLFILISLMSCAGLNSKNEVANLYYHGKVQSNTIVEPATELINWIFYDDHTIQVNDQSGTETYVYDDSTPNLMLIYFDEHPDVYQYFIVDSETYRFTKDSVGTLLFKTTQPDLSNPEPEDPHHPDDSDTTSPFLEIDWVKQNGPYGYLDPENETTVTSSTDYIDWDVRLIADEDLNKVRIHLYYADSPLVAKYETINFIAEGGASIKTIRLSKLTGNQTIKLVVSDEEFIRTRTAEFQVYIQ